MIHSHNRAQHDQPRHLFHCVFVCVRWFEDRYKRFYSSTCSTTSPKYRQSTSQQNKSKQKLVIKDIKQRHLNIKQQQHRQQLYKRHNSTDRFSLKVLLVPLLNCSYSYPTVMKSNWLSIYLDIYLYAEKKLYGKKKKERSFT